MLKYTLFSTVKITNIRLEDVRGDGEMPLSWRRVSAPVGLWGSLRR